MPNSNGTNGNDPDDNGGGTALAVLPIEIQEEMERSFLEYSMSVIVARALPDVRDGLKPVHRRILYAMGNEGLRPDRPFVKCARVVGDVMGRFHPHGDSAIYDALARMVQAFSLRHPLIEGHGDFGAPGPNTSRRPVHGVPPRISRDGATRRDRRRDRQHDAELRRQRGTAGRLASQVP